MENQVFDHEELQQDKGEQEWVCFSDDGQLISERIKIKTLEKDDKFGQCRQKICDKFTCCRRNPIPIWLKSECQALINLGAGLSFNAFLIFLIPSAITFSIGHLGKDELAAVGLGQSFCNLTGMVFGAGFVRASDTLCSQAYGAGKFKKIGIVTQRALLITTVIMFPIISVWINAEKILLALGQDPTVVRLACQFIDYFVPALMLYIMFNIVIRYLACQGIVRPLVYAAVFATVICAVSCYLFVYYFDLGLRGGALATDVAYLSLCAFLLLYICFFLPKSESWQGWSWECLTEWKQYMYLGFPSMAMIALEWWCFELGIFAMGAIGPRQQAAQISLFFVTGLIFFVSYGLSMATGVRVGHFLGAGQPTMAKRSIKASLIVVLIVTTVLACILAAAKNYVGYLFSSDSSVIAEISKTVYIVGIVEIFDGIMIVLNGGVRGAALQKYGALINLVGYAVIASASIAVLIFVAKMEVIGFWTGMIIGQLCQIVMFSVLLIKTDWDKLSREAKERSGTLQESISINSTSNDKIHLIQDEGRKYDSITSQDVDSNHIGHSIDKNIEKVAHDSDLSRTIVKDNNEFTEKKIPSKKRIITKVSIIVFSFGILIGSTVVRIYL